MTTILQPEIYSKIFLFLIEKETVTGSSLGSGTLFSNSVGK
jgi:hypothetical protein